MENTIVSISIILIKGSDSVSDLLDLGDDDTDLYSDDDHPKVKKIKIE
jgi:hypothetical protein